MLLTQIYSKYIDYFGFNKRELNRIKCLCESKYGRPYKKVAKEIRERYLLESKMRNSIKDFETTR